MLMILKLGRRTCEQFIEIRALFNGHENRRRGYTAPLGWRYIFSEHLPPLLESHDDRDNNTDEAEKTHPCWHLNFRDQIQTTKTKHTSNKFHYLSLQKDKTDKCKVRRSCLTRFVIIL